MGRHDYLRTADVPQSSGLIICVRTLPPTSNIDLGVSGPGSFGVVEAYRRVAVVAGAKRCRQLNWGEHEVDRRFHREGGLRRERIGMWRNYAELDVLSSIGRNLGRQHLTMMV